MVNEVGLEDRKHFGFSSFNCLLFPFHKRESMFAVLHSDIRSVKSGLVHLTGQPYCKKSRCTKVKDGIINSYFLGTILLIDTRALGPFCLKWQFTVVKNRENL